MTAEHNQTIANNDILIVNDETPDLKLLAEILGQAGYHVYTTENPQQAVDSIQAKPPALILLDVEMAEMDGFEVCKRLKKEKQTRGIPIIFICALKNTQESVRVFEAGGVDFIFKPFHEEEVLARVQTHMDLREIQLHREDMVAKRTDVALESEQRFRATFEHAAVGIAHVSKEGRFLRINKKFCDIVGYSEAEMLSMTFQDITHPGDLDADLDYIRQLLNRDIETYSMDKRYYRKDGSIIWINLTVSLVVNKGGRPDYFVSVVVDVSDRKQAEETLRQSRDFMEHLISAVPDAVFSIKIPERTINWVNDSFDVLGYEPEEYIGHTTKKYYASPEDYQAVGRLQQEAIRKGDNIIRTEIRVSHKDGRVIPAELTATYYREGGKLSQITALVRDISERKSAEEKLARSEAKYRGLVDNSIVGVFNSTLDGRFKFVNDAMVRMYDFDSVEQMIAHGSPARWKNTEDRDHMLDALQKHGRVANFEAETITNTGRHIWILFSAKLIGNDIIGMVMDITKRKQAENRIAEYQARLKALAYEVTIAEEKERRAIATDLHDYVGQSLALARMQIATLKSSPSGTDLSDKLDGVSGTLLKALEDTQTLMLELSAHSMHDTGLSSAISDWLEGEIRKHPIETEVINNVSENRRKSLAPEIRTILFRNVRELVVNAVKHAQAKKISIRLEDRDPNLRIIIDDDGVGFDLTGEDKNKHASGGFGLFRIEELMTDIGGNLKMISEPGSGCTAILSAPFTTNGHRGKE
jgi:PAS domain S-box-containing protein